MKRKGLWRRWLIAGLLLCLVVGQIPLFPVQAASRRVYGIDISKHQGDNVDFRKIKADGIDFVILRAGFTGHVDQDSGKFIQGKDIQFENYYAAAKAAGLEVGCYMYSYAENKAEAIQDAKDLKGWLKGKKLEYPVYYDMEDKCQLDLTTEQRTDITLAFIKEMEKDNYYTGVYANQYWLNSMLDVSRLRKYPIWMALWTKDGTDSSDRSDSCGMWQYTSEGSVNGISGNVDRDVCYVDYPAYIKENGLNGFTKPNYDPDLPFTDVKMTDWFYISAKFTYDHKLIAGTSPTTFSPNTPVTRGMFVSILSRMSGESMDEYTESHFLDVNMREYYGPAIMWAFKAGIVAGISDDFFAPDDTLTREQMCRMINRFALHQGITFSGEYANDFADEEEISSWAVDSVKKLAGAGIILGMGNGQFKPQGTATRAECASIVQRIS